MFKNRLLLLLSFLVLIFFPHQIKAQEYTNDYQAEYFVTQTGNELQTHVKLTIGVTHLKSDIFVQKLTIAFPKSFTIAHIKVRDDVDAITPTIVTDGLFTKVTASFNNPAIGKSSTNHLYLEFDQENLFKESGSIWEAVIPILNDTKENTYKVIVHLPENTIKKISLSKPKPDSIQDNTITWNTVSSRTIYALFGENQYYDVHLTYHLKNDHVKLVYTDIALPPDTIYQKIYLGSLNPKPATIFTDEDGNLLARYNLLPKQSLDIKYEGTIELSTKPRSEVRILDQARLANQKNYLLNTLAPYWNLPSSFKLPHFSNIKDIYTYVVNTLHYDYARLTPQGVIRQGAQYALSQPTQAVCTEFSDTFVALARKNGIMSREIQGFGVSNDPLLQPLSLSADILHSWPEYFDTGFNMWTPVDPTWENTSGIDYFSSLDLNHITFVIHGKEADYPLPAGMYKTDKSQDIQVKETTTIPKVSSQFIVDASSLPLILTQGRTYTGKLIIKNDSNVFAYQTKLKIQADHMIVAPSTLTIPVLAPGEIKELTFNLRSAQSGSQFKVLINDEVIYSKSFSVRTNLLFFILPVVGLFIIIGGLLLRFKFKVDKN